MTNVEVAESLTYGFKLFGYLVGVVVLGGGGLVLGIALAGPEITDGAVTDNLSSPELLGGIVLAALGAAVWLTGTFGLTYKLIADAVQWGVAAGTPEPSTDSESADRTPDTGSRTRTEPIGPSPGEQTAREFGPGSTVPGAASVSDRKRTIPSQPEPNGAHTSKEPLETTDTGQESEDVPEPEQAQTSREPAATDEPAGQERPDAADTASEPPESETGERTAEQIAFGTSGEDDQSPTETAESQPTPETGDTSAEDGSTEEGTIPPYEAIDGESHGEPRQSETATEGVDDQPGPGGETGENEPESGSGAIPFEAESQRSNGPLGAQGHDDSPEHDGQDAGSADADDSDPLFSTEDARPLDEGFQSEGEPDRETEADEETDYTGETGGESEHEGSRSTEDDESAVDPLSDASGEDN